ncbi:MAG: molybdenum cofactor biosynthesis protein MoaE [Pseudomonadota bacterium]
MSALIITVGLEAEPFSPEEAAARFRRSAEGAGAIVHFIGLVRDSASSEAVRGLFLQHAPGLTLRTIEKFGIEAAERWHLQRADIIHRIGEVGPGEPIVFVATAAAHRRAAFEGADFLMDHLKSEAPFWKKERRASGDVWIEPRAEDYADKARWT